jgi:hypothetical protein
MREKNEKSKSLLMPLLRFFRGSLTLFKLDYLEQFYPNQSFARLNPGVMAQRLISKD